MAERLSQRNAGQTEKAASLMEAAFLRYFYFGSPFASDIPNSPIAQAGNNRGNAELRPAWFIFPAKIKCRRQRRLPRKRAQGS